MDVREVLVLLKDIGLPVGGGVLSAAAALWKLSQRTLNRLVVVEARLREIDATVDTFSSRLASLKEEIVKLEGALSSTQAAMGEFAEGQGEKWSRLNHALGRLEGYAEGHRESVHDIVAMQAQTVPAPSMKIPRPFRR